MYFDHIAGQRATNLVVHGCVGWWLPRSAASRSASIAVYDFLAAAAASIASTTADAHPSATLRRYFSATLETHPALTTNSVRE